MTFIFQIEIREEKLGFKEKQMNLLDEAQLKEEFLSNGNPWRTQRTTVRKDSLPEEITTTTTTTTN